MVLPWRPVSPGAASERRDVWDELRSWERLLVPEAARHALMDDIGRAAAEMGCEARAREDNLYVCERGASGRLLFATALVPVKGTYDGR